MRKGFLIVWCCLGLSLQSLHGQDLVVPADSGYVQTRSPDPAALQAATQDPDFIYDREPVVQESLWDYIKRWINKILNPILTSRAMRPVWDLLPYILAIITVLFVASRLLKTDLRGLFQTSPKQKAPFTLLEEDLQSTDFDALIQAAVEAGRYRDAVRYAYLKALKILSDHKLINWQRDKTNRMYVHEINEPALRPSFADLTRQFAFIWYGNRRVEAHDYEQIQTAFNRFTDQVTTHTAS